MALSHNLLLAGEHLLARPDTRVVLMVAILDCCKRAGIDTTAATWLLVFASATLLALVIAVNEALMIMAASRSPLYHATLAHDSPAGWRRPVAPGKQASYSGYWHAGTVVDLRRLAHGRH